MIDEYNAGSVHVEAFFQKVVELSQQLNDEDQRAVREELSDEELAMFDLLTKPEIRSTRAHEIELKKIARQLLNKLKAERAGVSAWGRLLRDGLAICLRLRGVARRWFRARRIPNSLVLQEVKFEGVATRQPVPARAGAEFFVGRAAGRCA